MSPTGPLSFTLLLTRSGDASKQQREEEQLYKMALTVDPTGAHSMLSTLKNTLHAVVVCPS